MGRPRVYEAADLAQTMHRTFTARSSAPKHRFKWNWPAKMQFVGDSLSIGYSSDKWKDERGDLELYKHLAESRNRALVKPGFLVDADNAKKKIGTIGPMVDMADVPMPRDCAFLALLEEIDLELHVDGSNDKPFFGRKNEGIVKVTVAHGLLGGGYIRWSEVDEDLKDEVFVFAYTESDGPLVIITGDELDVLKDGIVG